jgi:hypothetical protein
MMNILAREKRPTQYLLHDNSMLPSLATIHPDKPVTATNSAAVPLISNRQFGLQFSTRPHSVVMTYAQELGKNASVTALNPTDCSLVVNDPKGLVGPNVTR